MRRRKRVKSQQSWRRRRRSSSIPNHPRFHCQPQNLHCLPFPTSPPTAATSLLSLVTTTTPASVLGASPKLSCLQSLLGWPASFKVPAQIRFPNNKSFPLIFIQFIKRHFFRRCRTWCRPLLSWPLRLPPLKIPLKMPLARSFSDGARDIGCAYSPKSTGKRNLPGTYGQ